MQHLVRPRNVPGASFTVVVVVRMCESFALISQRSLHIMRHYDHRIACLSSTGYVLAMALICALLPKLIRYFVTKTIGHNTSPSSHSATTDRAEMSFVVGLLRVLARCPKPLVVSTSHSGNILFKDFSVGVSFASVGKHQ